jgi:serine/threonine-protein kinase ATR
MALGGFAQTVSLACRLLDSFNPKMQYRAKHHDLILRQNFSWVLNGFHRLRHVIIEWLQIKGAQVTSEDETVPLQYLTYLHRCCLPESTLAGLLSSMSLTSTWSQCLCGFLSLENIAKLPSVQVILGRFLCDLTEAAKSSQPLVHQLRETLLPVLTEVKDGNSNFQSLESCLWVSCLSYLPQMGYRTNTRLESSPDIVCPASRYSTAVDSVLTQRVIR